MYLKDFIRFTIHDFYLRATHALILLSVALASLCRLCLHSPEFELHARIHLPAALASVSFGFVLVRVPIGNNTIASLSFRSIDKRGIAVGTCLKSNAACL